MSTESLAVAALGVLESPRLQGEDPEHTEMLAALDGQLPPIIVHRGTMRVLDGAHRLSAARLRGDTHIEARMFEGSLQEAFVLGVKANIAHGLPLSVADRTKAAERIVVSEPAWSDRTIASVTGISARTIGGLRSRMEQEGGLGTVQARVGQDGRMRPLDGAAGRLKAVEFIREHPDASLREVARHVGMSPSTVRDVRNRLQHGQNPVPRALISVSAPAIRPCRDLDRPDLGVVLDGLKRDPSLRFSESGRALLRWLFTRAVARDDWERMVDEIPPHSAFIVADVARRCSQEWRNFADILEQRTETEPAA